MISSDIWEDEKIAKLSYQGRLLFIGLITLASDYGKLRGNIELLKNKIFPYDTGTDETEKNIKLLNSYGIIKSYEVSGEKFLIITNWAKYQTLTYKGKNNIPDPIENTIKALNKPLIDPYEQSNITKVNISIEQGKLAKEILDYFFNKYKEKHSKKYVFNAGKDMKLLKTLLNTLTAEEIKHLVDKFFSSSDRFIKQAGHTIGVFNSMINKLQVQHKEDIKIKEL